MERYNFETHGESMNIYITKNMESTLDGYDTIPLLYGNLNLEHIPQHSCANILVEDALDSTNDPQATLINIISKLRKAGNLSIQGTDFDTMCRQYLNKNIASQDINTYVAEKNSICSFGDIQRTISQNNIKIISAGLNGVKFDIRATR